MRTHETGPLRLRRGRPSSRRRRRSQALVKQTVHRGRDRRLGDGVALGQDLFVESFRTDEAALGIKSFLENGPSKATFTGR